MFKRNAHGQLVWIPTVERLAHIYNTSLLQEAAIFSDAPADGPRTSFEGFDYPALRAQDAGADVRPVVGVVPDPTHQAKGFSVFGPITPAGGVTLPCIFITEDERWEVDADAATVRTPRIKAQAHVAPAA